MPRQKLHEESFIDSQELAVLLKDHGAKDVIYVETKDGELLNGFTLWEEKLTDGTMVKTIVLEEST